MSVLNVRQQARLQLQRYLLRFPQEQGRQAALCAQLDAADSDIFSRATLRGHITTSAVVIDVARRCVLLIHHAGLDKWLQPGGHHEAGQSLWASAVREVREETGLPSLQPHPAFADERGQVLMPFDIDSHPIPANPRKGEGAHVHHDYAYLALAEPDADLRHQPEEVHAAAWRPLDSLSELPDARLRLVREKLRALGL